MVKLGYNWDIIKINGLCGLLINSYSYRWSQGLYSQMKTIRYTDSYL